MLRAAVALSVLLFTIEAHAQVSGSLALLSDYRFRGVSRSDGRPAAQLAVALDRADGWYTGALVSSVRLEQNARPGAQLLSYAGFAGRFRSDLGWEVGAQYTRFTGHEHYAYPEIYLGLASEHFNGRLYCAPDYFGSGSAVCAELNGARMQSERVSLFGHLGMLRRNGHGTNYIESSPYRFDVRVGIGMTLRAGNVQLGWTTMHGGDLQAFGYPVGDRSTRNAWVISLSRLW